MVSGLLSLLALFGAAAGAWFFGSYRRAMKRAQRAILDSQKQVLSNAESERDQTEAKISGLDGHDLAAAIDDAFPSQKSDVHPDDAD